MRAKHLKIIQTILTQTPSASIVWKDIENALKAIGAILTEGSGSRVRVKLNGVRAVFHRPHPRKEADKGAIAAVKRFLLEAGVTYVDI